MSEYIIRRLLWFVPVILLTVTILFILLQVIPGDPIRAAFGEDIPLAQEQIDTLRADLGLDKPLYVRYFYWLWDLAHFDLGISFYTGASVKEQLLTRIPVTVGLVALAMIIMIAISLPSGILSGYFHDRWPDWIIRTISILFISLPHFWLAAVAILIMLMKFGWFASLEYVTIFSNPLAAVRQLALPAFVMALRPAGVATRMIRSSMIEVFEEDYIRTARAKGLAESIITKSHALPNSLIPVSTFYGLEVIIFVGTTTVMENIFGIAGVGGLVVEAAHTRDLYVLQGSVLILLFFAMFVNLGMDLLYAKLDPRIRFEQ